MKNLDVYSNNEYNSDGSGRYPESGEEGGSFQRFFPLQCESVSHFIIKESLIEYFFQIFEMMKYF